MGDLLYMALAYAVFWLFSFVFIYSIFNRQNKLEQDLTMLKQILDNQTDN